MGAANETYEIDVQAAMPEGDSVSAKLDSLTKSIMGAEKSADYLEAAFTQVTAALAAAKAATADADAALAEGNAQWAELETNANRAARAVEKAAAKGAVPDELQAQATAARQALDAYALSLGGLENAAADARASEQALAIFMGTTRDAAKQAATAEKAVADAAKEQAKAVEAAAKAQAQAEADAAKAAKHAADEAEKAAQAPLEAAKKQAEAYEKLRGSLASLPGPLGKIASAALAPVQGFQKLAGGMGQSRAAAVLLGAGAATLVVAIAAVTAAVVIGTVKLAVWAVGLADANRNAELATEAFQAMNPALAGLDFAGVAAETGQTAGALQGLAKSLDKAGVTADRMGKSLRVAALAATALGPEAAQEYVTLEQAAGDAQKAVDEAAKSGGTASKAQIEALAKASAAAADFAATAQTKLGGVVARQMLFLEAQSERFRSNVQGLFGGLNIEPVLQGLATLVALFDKNTAAGQALQIIFETVFQPLIDSAKTAATMIEAFYLGVLIGAMKLYVALKPTIKAVEEFFGLDGSPLEIDFAAISKVAEYVTYAFAGFAAIIGVVIGVVGLFVAAIAAIPAALIWIAAKFAELGPAIATTFSGAIDFVKTLPAQFVTLGAQLVAGLAQGIAAGASAVVGSISNVVSGAISAAKGLLGIASPSKVFAGIGDNTAQGFAGGVEDSTDAAHQAMATMVSPDEALNQAALSGDVGAVEKMQGLDAAATPLAAAPAAAPAADPSAAGPGGKSVTIDTVNVYANDRAGGQDAADSFYERLTQLIEGDAAQAAGA